MSRLISTKQVAELIGCNPKTIIRHASNGDFPAPIRLGGRGHPRWDTRVVQAWITGQMGERHQRITLKAED